jgi:hypothetical protein
MSIQLEVGKAYRTRSGARVVCHIHDQRDDTFLVTYADNCQVWHRPNGHLVGGAGTCPGDLIAEWTDEAGEAQHETNPVALPVAGMTLRQWYAGLAMQGIVSGAPTFDYSDGCAARVATHALHLADALLAALAEREG